ncbi:MAG: selenium metabolism-associated LysR family transcriptional regulator [Thermodesulfobacteriota bacterium]|nr:selenium metabolism-associated LysR family transcriptional regulator [Thermodesulfobacteriota bacterium]
MDFRQLEILCKVIELGSFSKAGEAVYLTQPTISEHIKSLEENLGTRLLDRMGKEVIPTKAGEIIYKYAKQLLKIRVEAKQVLENFSRKMVGEITIGGSNIPGEYILPHLLGKFKDSYPGASIYLSIGDTRDIVDQVLNNRIEIGIVGAKIQNTRLEYSEFIKDELVLAIPPNHTWAPITSISPEELKNGTFIIRERGSGTRMTIESVLNKAGIGLNRLNIIAEMGSTEAVRQGIKAGIGVSILSKRAIGDELKSGIFLEKKIEGIRFIRNFYVVTLKGKTKSPLVNTFFSFLLESIPKEQPDLSDDN